MPRFTLEYKDRVVEIDAESIDEAYHLVDTVPITELMQERFVAVTTSVRPGGEFKSMNSRETLAKDWGPQDRV